MRYFGERIDAPLYEEIEHAPTPVGSICLPCGDLIDADDNGYLIPNLSCPEFGGGVVESAWHRECLLTNVLGPLATQLLERRDRTTDDSTRA